MWIKFDFVLFKCWYVANLLWTGVQPNQNNALLWGRFPQNLPYICIVWSWECFIDLGVSKNNGTPKWMVYNGKPMKTLLKWMIWGYHYFWKHPFNDPCSKWANIWISQFASSCHGANSVISSRIGPLGTEHWQGFLQTCGRDITSNLSYVDYPLAFMFFGAPTFTWRNWRTQPGNQFCEVNEL